MKLAESGYPEAKRKLNVRYKITVVVFLLLLLDFGESMWKLRTDHLKNPSLDLEPELFQADSNNINIYKYIKIAVTLIGKSVET